MKLVTTGVVTLAKLGLFAAAIVVAAFGLAQDAKPASAAQTEIFFSYSASSPLPAPAIILNPNGPTRNVYIWAKGVTDTSGVSGFTLAVSFQQGFVGVTIPDANGIGDPAWLGSTGRSPTCINDAFPQPGEVAGQCSTLIVPPPFGPQGDGLLGQLILNPAADLLPSSPLAFVPPAFGVVGTFLVNTPPNPDNIQVIPATLRGSSVVYFNCGDNSPEINPQTGERGDGIVDLPNDILGVILRFGWNDTNPDWHPAFDLNNDGVIDLPNDILGTILQFQLTC